MISFNLNSLSLTFANYIDSLIFLSFKVDNLLKNNNRFLRLIITLVMFRYQKPLNCIHNLIRVFLSNFISA